LTVARDGSRVVEHRGDRMDPSTTLVILLVAAALIGWLAGARDGRGLEAFGLGFIGYRSYGWPRGVQEEDSVHFSVAAWHEHAADGEEGGGHDGVAELIEIEEPTETVPLERLR
jgi:hypothetical protein